MASTTIRSEADLAMAKQLLAAKDPKRSCDVTAKELLFIRTRRNYHPFEYDPTPSSRYRGKFTIFDELRTRKHTFQLARTIIDQLAEDRRHGLRDEVFVSNKEMTALTANNYINAYYNHNVLDACEHMDLAITAVHLSCKSQSCFRRLEKIIDAASRAYRIHIIYPVDREPYSFLEMEILQSIGFQLLVAEEFPHKIISGYWAAMMKSEEVPIFRQCEKKMRSICGCANVLCKMLIAGSPIMLNRDSSYIAAALIYISNGFKHVLKIDDWWKQIPGCEELKPKTLTDLADLLFDSLKYGSINWEFPVPTCVTTHAANTVPEIITSERVYSESQQTHSTPTAKPRPLSSRLTSYSCTPPLPLTTTPILDSNTDKKNITPPPVSCSQTTVTVSQNTPNPDRTVNSSHSNPNKKPENDKNITTCNAGDKGIELNAMKPVTNDATGQLSPITQMIFNKKTFHYTSSSASTCSSETNSLGSTGFGKRRSLPALAVNAKSFSKPDAPQFKDKLAKLSSMLAKNKLPRTPESCALQVSSPLVKGECGLTTPIKPAQSTLQAPSECDTASLSSVDPDDISPHPLEKKFDSRVQALTGSPEVAKYWARSKARYNCLNRVEKNIVKTFTKKFKSDKKRLSLSLSKKRMSEGSILNEDYKRLKVKRDSLPAVIPEIL